MAGLTQRTVAGFAWMATGKAAHGVVQLLVLAILGRLLTPTEFGVVSAALVTIAFSNIVSQLGLGPAIVQRPELEPRHTRTAFGGSAVLGLLLGGLLWVAAPFAARFFNAAQVEPVLRTLIIIFPIQGLGVVAESLARRELQFRWLSTLDIKSYGLGYGVVAVVMALGGYGIWALVWGEIAQAAIRTALLLRRFPAPRLPLPEPRALRELIYFGGGFTLAKIANFLAVKGDNLMVGHLLGPAALGVYGRAYHLMAAPTNSFGSVLDHVLFPAMARVQSEVLRLQTAYRRGLTAMALLVLPSSGAFIVLAPELISVLLGPRWSAVVAPFRVLAVVMVFHVNSKIGDSLARATGAVYRRAWRQVLYAAGVLAGAYLGSRWGVVGVAACVGVAIASNFLFMSHLSLSLAGLSWRDLLTAHLPAFLVAALTTLVIGGTATGLRYWSAPPAIIVAAALLLSAAALLLLLRGLPRSSLNADIRWALELADSKVPGRLRFLFTPRRPPVSVELPSKGTAR